MDRRSRGPGGGRRLTDRQTTILELVAAGKENKEIGFALGISEQAVKEHVSNLLHRLAAPNRAALADAAATRRFVGTFDIDPQWLRFLFQHAPIHVAVVSGPEHRYVAVNDTCRSAAGDREIVGLAHRDAFPHDGSLADLDHVYRTGERFTKVDGDRTAVLQPLPGADGTTGGIAIFSIDTTPLRA